MDAKILMVVDGFLIVHQITAPVSFIHLALIKTMTFCGYPVKKNAILINATFQ